MIEILKYAPQICKDFTAKNKIDKPTVKEFLDYMKEVHDKFKEIIYLPED
ncbi:hypothetical protein [Acetivibrio mesophilus]|nr:hypothetical protein [Acetivibrio mesophilus]HHV28417.1 hypothetical protein [Clostridium sp.]